jgi:hypothetical protein
MRALTWDAAITRVLPAATAAVEKHFAGLREPKGEDALFLQKDIRDQLPVATCLRTMSGDVEEGEDVAPVKKPKTGKISEEAFPNSGNHHPMNIFEPPPPVEMDEADTVEVTRGGAPVRRSPKRGAPKQRENRRDPSAFDCLVRDIKLLGSRKLSRPDYSTS